MAEQKFPYKESLRVGMLLAGTAGYIDSYTFAFHDNRFASFQSGNLLQLGINVASGKWHTASLFFWPVIAFFVGAVLNQIIKKASFKNEVQWEERSVFIELLGVLFVAFLELAHVNSLIVLSVLAIFMAMQADTFSKLRGMPYATVLSTGNLKTFGATWANGFLNHDKSQFIKTRNVGLVIASFLGAAIIAHFLGLMIGDYTLFGAPILLAFVWFFVRQDRLETK